MVSRRPTAHNRGGTHTVHDVAEDSSEGKVDEVEETRKHLLIDEHKPWYSWIFNYSSYVLLLLLFAYLLNQLDRYMLAITIKSVAHDLKFGDVACSFNAVLPAEETRGIRCNATSKESCLNITNTAGVAACEWDFSGQGLEYQILAGPVFILDYTFVGILVGFAADTLNRKNMLAACLVFWSVMTMLTGLATKYWQLVVIRILLGMGEAGCTPFAISILTDYFPTSHHGMAVSFYNLGIYTGYSLAFALGNYITLANINQQGWRWAFYISGFPGVFLGILIFLTVREPQRVSAPSQDNATNSPADNLQMTPRQKLRHTLSMFAQPSVILLCMGGSLRNAGGYVWAYNSQPYFEAVGQTKEQIGSFMSWVPLMGGSLGVILGGKISDAWVQKLGPVSRVLVLTSSQLIAAPFAASTLLFKAPVSYVMQIPTYVIGEMWVGVALAVLVELVGSKFKTTAVAVYLFIITNTGGTVPLLVPPIQHLFEKNGYQVSDALRGALYVLYPGMYVAGGLLFLLAVCILRQDRQHSGYIPLNE